MGWFWAFLSGALLCNAIPHLAAGLRGEAFPTPFARPRGIGLSPAVTNVLWGSANLFLGIWLTARHAEFVGTAAGTATMAAGFVVLGVYLGWHFGRTRKP